MSARTSLLLSLLVGVSLEVIVAAYSGRREAWDSTAYWVGLPLAAIAAGLIGDTVAFVAPRFRRRGHRP
jgi:hypothetical protein